MSEIKKAYTKARAECMSDLTAQVAAEWPIIERAVLRSLKKGDLKVQIAAQLKDGQNDKVNGASPPARHLQKAYCQIIADKLDVLGALVFVDQRNGYGSRDYLIIQFSVDEP